MDNLMTPKEVAELLNIQQATVYKRFDAGVFGDAGVVIFKGPRKRTIRFHRDKLMKLFNLV